MFGTRRIIGAVITVAGLVTFGGWAWKTMQKFKPGTILSIGDSLTAAGTYTKTLAKLAGVAGIYKGFVGKGARWIADRVDASWASDPAIVVVLAGVNDLAGGRTVEQTFQALSGLYSRVKATWPNAKLVAVKLTPWGGYPRGKGDMITKTRQLNALIDASPLPDRVVDPSSLGSPDGVLNTMFSADGLHMKKQGYEELARQIYEQVF